MSNLGAEMNPDNPNFRSAEDWEKRYAALVDQVAKLEVERNEAQVGWNEAVERIKELKFDIETLRYDLCEQHNRD